MTFPTYQNINLSSENLKWGYYILGMIEQYRPDIELIGIRQDREELTEGTGSVKYQHHEVDYSWLPAVIEQAIKSNKKAVLLPNDEHVFYEKNSQLTEIVNYYKDQSLYWLTEFDDKRSAMHYRRDHGMECKILEFPWCSFNECMVYDKVRQQHNLSADLDYSNTKNIFVTLTGRYEPFRRSLIESLISHELYQNGQILIQQNQLNHYQDLVDYLTVESYDPYQTVPIDNHEKMAAQFLNSNGIWLTCNTVNFLYIEKAYREYPLAIIPETFYGNYFPTEKSFWPALLGKLFLIVGSPGCMANVQKYYDVDMSEFLNLKFDDVDCEIDKKIEIMIQQNRDFILNAKKIYAEYYSKIQTAKETITPNFYRFILNQLSQIK